MFTNSMPRLAMLAFIWLGAPLQMIAAANLQVPADGQVDLVFPHNDTYAVVSPFPVIFAFRNPQVLLNFDSELYYEVRCDLGSLHAIQRITGTDDGTFSFETFFAINTTRTRFEGLPKNMQDDFGPYGFWQEGDVDNCTLDWEFGYITTCKKHADGSIAIGSGGGGSKGQVAFSLKPGGTLPQKAVASYDGCPVPLAARRIDSPPISTCPEIGEQPDTESCQVDVKAAASSLASVVGTPTTTFTGAPTSTTSSSTSAAGTSKSDGGSSDDKKSAASLLFAGSSRALALVMTGTGVLGVFGVL